ncbi:YjhX family toxin [Brevundimonas sp. TWP2-3-4b1]|uniref:YjhX family toxin n=1 Tax=Brevundimonas sp. TWP2-3-4b1 TaxID=2804580 RepID=UPI003CF4F41D
MNISRAEQRTLHALAQGGAIVLERDPDGQILKADCFTRDGFQLADCILSVWKKLKTKGLIQSLDGGPYRVNREGLARMRSQLDNRVSSRGW